MLSAPRCSLRVRTGGSDGEWGLHPLTVCISNRDGLRKPRAWGVLLPHRQTEFQANLFIYLVLDRSREVKGLQSLGR